MPTLATAQTPGSARCKAAFSATLTAPGSWIAYQGVPIENLYPQPLRQITTSPIGEFVCGPGLNGYAHSITSGAMPAGIDFSEGTGIISGAPTVVPSGGSQVFTYTIRTAYGLLSSNFGSDLFRVPPSDTYSESSRDVSITVIRKVETLLNTAEIIDGAFRQRAGQAISFRPVAARYGLQNDRVYSVSPALPAGLSMNSTNGLITGTAAVGTNSVANYTVTITDRAPAAGGGFQSLGTATRTFSLALSSALLGTAQGPSGTGVVIQNGSAFTPFQPVTVAGASGSLSFSISGDALPSGLVFNGATGILSGTSNGLVGTYDYIMRVTDTAGQIINVPFKLTFGGLVANLQVPRVAVSSGIPIAGTVIPVSFSGGVGSRTITVSPALPAGLTIDVSSGQLTGSTTEVVSGTYTVTGRDGGSPQSVASRDFQLVVDGLPPFINTISNNLFITSGGGEVTLTGFQMGPRFGSNPKVQLGGSVVGGVPSGGIIIPNVSYASDGRSLSFTIPAFTSTNVLESLYVSTDSGFARISVRIGRPLLVGTYPKLIYASGQAVDLFPFNASDGAGPVIYDAGPSSLGDLLLNRSTGQVTGTMPTTPGDYGFCINIYDDTGIQNGLIRCFNYEVKALVTATAISPTVTVQQGQPVPANFKPVTTVGGLAPLTFSASRLPAGLTMDPTTGIISGTPLNFGTTTTVFVADATTPTPNSARADVRINVAGFRLTQTIGAIGFRSGRTTSNTTNGIVPFTVEAGSGEVGTVTYSISPALPAGFNFDTATGRITGVPTARIPYSTFTVAGTDQATPLPAIARGQFRLEVLDEDPSISNMSPVIGPLAGNTPVTITGRGFGPRFANATAVTIGGTPVNNLVIAPDGLSMTFTTPPSATATNATLLIANTGLINLNTQATFTYQNPIPPPPLVSTLANPAAIMLTGAVSRIRPVTATGGTGTLSYAIAPASGGVALPSTLVFNATDGTITGQPTATKIASNYVITVTDQATPALTTSQTFSLTVNDPPPIIPAIGITAINGSATSATFPIKGGSRVILTGANFAAGMTATVAGIAITDLVINSATSLEFTMPVVAGAVIGGTAQIVLTRAGAPNTGIANFAWGANLQLTPISIGAYVVGQPSTGQTLVLPSGGFGAVTYKMDDGAGGPIPAGMTFNATTGALSGTPTAGFTAGGTGNLSTKRYRIIATDSDNPKSSAETFNDITIGVPLETTLVIPTLVIEPNKPMDPVAPVTKKFGVDFTTGNGTGAFLTTGLPSGLIIDRDTGVITGTPAFPGVTTTFTITVEDLGASNVYAARTQVHPVTLTVGPTLTTTKVADIITALGSSVTSTPVTATGGAGTRSYAIEPALPFGLTLNSATGEISGTASSPQLQTQHTIVVTDQSPIPAERRDVILVTVSPPLPTITSISRPSGTALGGTKVIITGTNFREWPSYGRIGTGLRSAGTLIAGIDSFTVDSDTQITAITGNVAPGSYDFAITSPQGNSADTSADDYQAVAGLSLTATLTGPASASGNFDVEMTTSEAVTPLLLLSWQITNGTAIAVRSRTTTQIVTIRPTATGPVTIYVPANFAAGLDTGTRIARTNDLTINARLLPTVEVTVTGTNSSASSPTIKVTEFVNFTFLEPVTDFDLSDLATNMGTTLSNFNANFGGTNYSVQIDRVSDGLATVTIAGAVKDANGVDVSASGTYSYTVDRTAPRLTASGPTNARLYSGPVRVTWTASEDITGFTGTRGGFGQRATQVTVPVEGARVFESTITPNPNLTDIYELQVFGAVDAAGNNAVIDFTPTTANDPSYDPNSGSLLVQSAPFYLFDGEGSYVTVSQATGANPVAGVFDAKIDFTYVDRTNGFRMPQFDGVVSFTAANVTVVNGTVARLICPTSARFTEIYGAAIGSCTATIAPNGQGPVSVSVAASVTTDRAGNSNRASNVLTLAIAGNVVPGVAPVLSLSVPSPISTGRQLATFSFSKAVENFDEDDITSNAGTRVEQFTAINASTFTAFVSRATDGNAEISVFAGAANDVTGMASLAATATFMVDTTDPTAMVSVFADTIVPAQPFDATITFSEPVTGFELADLAILNATASDLRPGPAPNSYLVTITPGTGSSVEVGVFDGAAIDAAGNRSRTLSLAVKTIDRDLPTATLALAVPNPRVSGPFDLLATFSKPAVGIVLTDFAAINATLSNLTCISSDALTPAAVATCTFTVTPVIGTTVSVSLGGGNWQDRSGNSGASASFSIATAPPNPSVTLTAPAGTKSAPFVMTVTFSEAVTGFELTDLVVTNATASTLTGTGPAYSVTITPLSDGQVTIALPAASAASASGAPSLAATSLVVTADVTAPSLVLSTGSVRTIGSFVVGFQFSESVTGFDASDITVTNATVTNFAGTGSAYSATLTPINDGAVSVQAIAGVASDAAGLASLASNILTVQVDTKPPTVTLTAPPEVQGGPFVVTIEFSEVVTGFELNDVTVTNGLVSNLTGTGPRYSVTITPAATGSTRISIAAGAVTDAAGLSLATSQALTVEVDLSGPKIETRIPSAVITLNVNSTETDLTKIKAELALVNLGASSGRFSASASVNWLTVTPGQGELAPNQTVNLIVSPNANVNRLAAGRYQGVVNISYTASNAPISSGFASGPGSGEGSSPAVATQTFAVPFDIVVAARRGSVTIVAATAQPARSGDATFTYSSAEASLNALQLTTVSGRAVSRSFDLDVGRYDIKQNLPANWTLSSINCVGDTDGGTTINLEARSAVIDVDGGESLTCTFTNSLADAYVIIQTERAVYSLLTQRARLLASNEPEIEGRLEATGGAGVGTNGRFNFNAQGGRIGMDFKGSLSALWTTPDTRAALSRLMAGEADAVPAMSLSRIDVWLQGNWASATLKDRESNNFSKSDFGVIYLGADYLMSADLRFGLLAQYDTIDQKGQLGQTDSSGTGWMLGPYLAWRAPNGLAVSGRAAWGKSSNTINPLGRYEDEFDGSRMMASARLSKEMKLFEAGNSQWSLRPETSVYYFQEEQLAFTSALGPRINANLISLGEVRVGPELIYRTDLSATSEFEWRIKLMGVATFDPAELIDESGLKSDGLDRYSARLETGFRLQVGSGFTFDGRLNFDGLGSASNRSYGASVSIAKSY